MFLLFWTLCLSPNQDPKITATCIHKKTHQSSLNSICYWPSPLASGPFDSQQEAPFFKFSFQIQTTVNYKIGSSFPCLSRVTVTHLCLCTASTEVSWHWIEVICSSLLSVVQDGSMAARCNAFHLKLAHHAKTSWDPLLGDWLEQLLTWEPTPVKHSELGELSSADISDVQRTFSPNILFILLCTC